MYLTILDFRKGKVIIQKYKKKDFDHDHDFENHIQSEILGHSDFNFICTNELILSINDEEDSIN
jgi:hypothetical protein